MQEVSTKSVTSVKFTLQNAINVLLTYLNLPTEQCSFYAFLTFRDLLGFYYPAPDRGTGCCNRAISFFVSLFVSLSATLRENGWTDLHEIFREGVE